MSDVQLNTKTFFKRAAKIFDAWDQAGEGWEEAGAADALLVVMGDSNETVTYSKSSSLQQYLLGYEFPSTLIVFHKSPRRVTFVGSASKGKIINQLKTSNGIEIDMQVRGKDEASARVIPALVESLAGKTVGHLPKDTASGKIPDEWKSAVEDCKPPIPFVDMANAISAVLSDKDGEELQASQTSARMTSTAMTHYFKAKLESVIDRGTKMSNQELADLVDEKVGNEEKEPDMKLWKKNPQLGEIDWSSVEWGVNPIVQSGGKYDVRLSAVSADGNVSRGVVTCTMGVRYKTYSSLMSRTFMIDPTPQQEKYYSVLLEARQEAFKRLKPGAVAKEVYEAVQAVVAKKSGTLGSVFGKTIGFQTGIELRDSNFTLGPKNVKKVQENMVLVVSLSVTDLADQKKNGQKYSLIIADTVRIGTEGAIALTEGTVKLSDIATSLDEESEAESEEEVKPQKKERKDNKPSSSKANGKDSSSKSRPSGPVGGARMTRGQRQSGPAEQTSTEKIKPHQDKLHAQRQSDGLKRFQKGGKGKNGQEEKQIKKYESYRREEQLPKQVEDRRVYVDEQRSTIVLPIHGYAVPFHISTIKNVTKTEEAEYVVLRINFQSPGQIAGKKEDMPFEDPDATFVRSASFRSKDSRHMLRVFDSITALKKAATKREAERKEMADVIEQEKLLEIKGRHPYVLKGVYPRPALDGKKTDGNLEIHQNGVRFRPDGPQNKIDVLFSNVKHLFFQPSEKELIVLIHFHLRSPIMIGKKKTYDVQFYRDVTDGFDETGGKKRRARYGDEDEIEQEQEERRRRAEHDKVFQDFARRIEQAALHQQNELEVDLPFRELGFNGVPYRSNVVLTPTANCLIHVSEQPFTVITLAEIEIVHLERIQFGLKNFDMVFVLRDFKKPPVHINNVPVSHLDDVKEWLDSCDVPLSEGPVNLSWPAIMKTVNDDPYAFFEEGGWGFITGGGEDGSDSESEEESEFEADSDVFDEEESDSDSEDDSDFGSDSDSDASDFDDESGEDWDELERKAKKSDDKRREANGDSSDDGKSKKKKGGRR